jgi:hypothetical protein
LDPGIADLRIPRKSKTRTPTTQTMKVIIDKSPNQVSKGSIKRKKMKNSAGNSTSHSNCKTHKETSVNALQNLENVDEWAD